MLQPVNHRPYLDRVTSDASSDHARPDPKRRAGFVAVVFDMDGVLTDTEVI